MDFLTHSFKLGYGANQMSRRQLATIDEMQDKKSNEWRELKLK